MKAKFILTTILILMLSIFTACQTNNEDDSAKSFANTTTITNGRYVRADGATDAGYPWLEFNGKQITFPLYGGVGGASDKSDYTFNDGSITFQLEGVDITWEVEIINDNKLMVDIGGWGVKLEYVREGGNDVVTNPEHDEQNTIYQSLNLPLTITEKTFEEYGRENILKITPNGDLIRITSIGWNNTEEVVIDNNVRSLFVHGISFFYIKNDNSLWAYGDNSGGMLGDGTGVNRDSPVKILDDVAWVGLAEEPQVFVYFIHNMIYTIKTDKTLWTWGGSTNYEPVMIAENVIRILRHPNLGQSIMVIQTKEGFILDSATNEFYTTLPNEPLYDIKFGAVSQYGSGSSIQLYGWIDSNRNLRLGERTSAMSATFNDSFIAADVDKFNVNRRSAGWVNCRSLSFIKTDGTLWGYGENEEGQLGDGTKINRDEPVKIADDVAEVYDYGFLKTNGEIWTWDSNNPTPENKGGGNDRVIKIKHNEYLRITTDGTVYRSDTLAGTFNNKSIIENVKIPSSLTFD